MDQANLPSETLPLLAQRMPPPQSPRRTPQSSPSRSTRLFVPSSLTGAPDSPSLFPAAHHSSSSRRFEISSTMNRLRSSMVGRTALSSTQLADQQHETDETPQHESTRNKQQSSSLASTITSSSSSLAKLHGATFQWGGGFSKAMGQVPAIALIAMFHLMIGIPFGVSYFPLYWSSSSSPENNQDEEVDEEGLGGPFPLPGKEALGIRMFLFSTIVGQIVFTATSQFDNPIGLQMVENVPFCHELSAIVLRHQGIGIDALSTLIVMFGLSSIIVGVVFYLLGKLELGRIVYFFPTHVLIGCIGGIGVFIAKTGVEVTIDETFSMENIMDKFHLFRVVLLFEIVLRILEQVTKDKDGKPKYTLLSPIYFCLMTPIFYAVLAIFKIPMVEAEEAGYFFPALDQGEDGGSESASSASFWGSIFGDPHLWDMWTVVDFPSVSWLAIWDSIPTLVALTLFSLIHVPINIPAFSLSTSTEVDMNNELIAHGYSNVAAGVFGGLQNYMAYTQSVLYDKSGGTGKPSGLAVAVVTSLLFFVGPTIASFIPRCMAGTLLLHVGLDLFLEGVYDSYGKFDPLEYFGIWLIVVVMTLYGMEAAMIAGVIAAVSTYAVQSVAYLSPIRGSMSAATLRSSMRLRDLHAQSILNSPTDGRSRILVIQLQGHLFFGNMAHFTSSMHSLVRQNVSSEMAPVVIIMDCSLVLGIDSSAAQAITKLKDALLKKYKVDVCIFVTGSDEGFPTSFSLSDQLSANQHFSTTSDAYLNGLEQVDEDKALLSRAAQVEHAARHKRQFTGSHVFNSLDDALIFAEDALIWRKNPSLLDDASESNLSNRFLSQYGTTGGSATNNFLLNDEKELGIMYLTNICPVYMKEGDTEYLFSLFQREVYQQGQFVWKQHSPSDSMKLLIFGMLIAELENEAGTTETISKGNTIGETGLVNNSPRMSSVRCLSEEAIVYSMSRQTFEMLVEARPHIARYIDLICINYLQSRVQHVSNRIFETRCLPI